MEPLLFREQMENPPQLPPNHQPKPPISRKLSFWQCGKGTQEKARTNNCKTHGIELALCDHLSSMTSTRGAV